MAFEAMALLRALFWLVAEAATILRIISGLMPPSERSCAAPVKARPIASASVVNLFIICSEMILRAALDPRAGLIASLTAKVVQAERNSKKNQIFLHCRGAAHLARMERAKRVRCRDNLDKFPVASKKMSLIVLNDGKLRRSGRLEEPTL